MSVFRGERLKLVRQERGMSQEKLAELLTADPGRPLPQQHVSRWESGGADPSAEHLVRMAHILDVSVDYLLGVVDDPGDHLKVTVPRDALRERLNWALDKGDIPQALELIATIAKG